MKIHSDILTSADIYRATADLTGVYAEAVTKGSRSRKNGVEFSLTGTSHRRPNTGQRGAGDDYAATWDEWGIVLGRLFEADPNMTCTYYTDRDDFNFKTGSRFLTLTHAQQCKNHKFEYQGTAATGAYHFAVCSKCEAIKRY